MLINKESISIKRITDMKLQKIKLNKLAENSLANREMKELKGGNVCGCGCCYAGSGGSSTEANGSANNKSNYYSPGCDNEWVVTP